MSVVVNVNETFALEFPLRGIAFLYEKEQSDFFFFCRGISQVHVFYIGDYLLDALLDFAFRTSTWNSIDFSLCSLFCTPPYCNMAPQLQTDELDILRSYVLEISMFQFLK